MLQTLTGCILLQLWQDPQNLGCTVRNKLPSLCLESFCRVMGRKRCRSQVPCAKGYRGGYTKSSQRDRQHLNWISRMSGCELGHNKTSMPGTAVKVLRFKRGSAGTGPGKQWRYAKRLRTLVALRNLGVIFSVMDFFKIFLKWSQLSIIDSVRLRSFYRNPCQCLLNLSHTETPSCKGGWKMPDLVCYCAKQKNPRLCGS